MPPAAVRRIAAAVSLIALVGTGLAVHALLPDTTATDIAGDALYAAAVYAGLVMILPRWRPLAVAAIAAAWCIAVELLQLTSLPRTLGAVTPVATLVLGTAFDARDLVVYVAAVAVAWALDVAAAAARRRRAPADLPQHAPNPTMEP